MSDAVHIRFASVACVRGGATLFEDMTFVLGDGDALLVTGPNGAGKSSLVRIAAGLLAPARGEVARGDGVAMLAESLALDMERPLIDALSFWARLDGGDDRVGDALQAMALAPLSQVPVRMLSTGQRRRAAMARVIASGAPLWLLDEPANGLDTASLSLLEAAVAAHRAGGGAVLVASHVPIALPGAIVRPLIR